MIDRALNGFNRWFASGLGVFQTFALVLAIVIFELIDPHADSHGFWLLYYLTVYSAITQPALAYIAARSGESQAKSDAENVAVLKHLQMVLEHLQEMRDHNPDDPFRKTP